MHSHHNATAYFESGGRVVVHLPGGGTAELKPSDGFIMWREAWTHRAQNVGKTGIRAIIVEPK